ncbi:MAG: GFA family protein [Gammaproteobacteria bacterium]|jgi:hypothetical protein
MLKGSCLCGAVKYEIHGDLRKVLMCHCRNCRKASGAAFATNAVVDPSDLKITQGEDRIAEYESTPGVLRRFCPNCGSPLYSRRPANPTFIAVRMGTLDTPVDIRPSGHIFVGSKAEWDVIHDDLPQFEELP